MNKKINDFIVFCLEVYKEKYKITGKEVYKIFNEYKVFEYLEDVYEVLHTQGEWYIINEIEEFIKARKQP